MAVFLFCLLFCSFLQHICFSQPPKFIDQFDTYNPECKRVRRSWNHLPKSERDLFLTGLLKLREKSNGDPTIDELVIIASTHTSLMAKDVHFSSDYLFWHGYLLWELESRIRNLGGEYSCFGMPYWDFSAANDFELVPGGSSPIVMFEGSGLGGLGDENNAWNVNEYSWPITTQQYWVPMHCTAAGDEYPYCSLKRASSIHRIKAAGWFGDGIIDHPQFRDFSEWYAESIDIPKEFLVRSPDLADPVSVSYDPIWFLFHSMVSYHQAIWTDCNQYDLIPIDELEYHKEAYEAYCDEGKCEDGRGLDARIMIGGRLSQTDWSWISGQKTRKSDLTVKKRYYMPRWNVIYDLNGDDFFWKSGVKDWCGDRLNDTWFMYDEIEADTPKAGGIEAETGGNREIEAETPKTGGIEAETPKADEIEAETPKADEIEAETPKAESLNVYDTYNAEECRRVRRPWNALTQEERQLYIDGAIELRKRGNADVDLDEFIGIASAHDDEFGGITHHDSDYVFWHGYLVWEFESRIRNLGGKYACFGMPYWDYTNEYGRPEGELPYIFSTGLGGDGDPEDHWKVNGYSWDIGIKDWWTTYQQYCVAKGDDYPVCSLKRHSIYTQEMTPAEIGADIMDSPDFATFSRWIAGGLDVPKKLFNKDSAYDPIWYLYHSTESYYQGLWVNCNDFDLIDTADLTNDGEAFTAYCDLGDTGTECIDIKLDDPLYFPNLLKGKEWSYVHSNDLTIRKLYDFSRWNIQYDTNGDDFYVKSGLNEFCEGKLNEEWFIKPNNENIQENNVLSSRVSAQRMMDNNYVVLAVVISVAIGIVICSINYYASDKGRAILPSRSGSNYGSMI